MSESESPGKVEAIFQVREAAEKKVHAERDLDAEPTPDNRDALLDAQIELEKKTHAAIEACHECGHEHEPGKPHGFPPMIARGGDNVLRVDFGSTSTPGDKR